MEKAAPSTPGASRMAARTVVETPRILVEFGVDVGVEKTGVGNA